MRVPIASSPEIQQAFRELWRELEIWQSAPVVDLRKRRIGNAGVAVEDDDYVTKKEVDSRIADVVAEVDAGTFAEDVTITGDLILARMATGSVLFVTAQGIVDQDNENLYWDALNARLGLGTSVPETRLTLGSDDVFGWVARSRIQSEDDGDIVLFNNAETDFDLLQFGGTSSTAPALRRVNADLQVRLADDSDFANFVAAQIDTGQGLTEVHLMDQNIQTTDAVTFASVDTGQGANELYAMDQDVQTSDSPSFAGLTLNSKSVSEGANDSGGAGFRVLRVPN